MCSRCWWSSNTTRKHFSIQFGDLRAEFVNNYDENALTFVCRAETYEVRPLTQLSPHCGDATDKLDDEFDWAGRLSESSELNLGSQISIEFRATSSCLCLCKTRDNTGVFCKHRAWCRHLKQSQVYDHRYHLQHVKINYLTSFQPSNISSFDENSQLLAALPWVHICWWLWLSGHFGSSRQDDFNSTSLARQETSSFKQ